MWASVGMTLSSGRRWQKGWQSWVSGRVRGHPALAEPVYQPYPQTGWPADPGSWKSSVSTQTI